MVGGGDLGVDLVCSEMWSGESKYEGEDENSENKMRAWG
jgi:hypothetical protein